MRGLKAQSRRGKWKAAALRVKDHQRNPFLPPGWKSAETKHNERFYWKADDWKKPDNPPPPKDCPELKKGSCHPLAKQPCSVCEGTGSSTITTWIRPTSDLTVGRKVLWTRGGKFSIAAGY